MESGGRSNRLRGSGNYSNHSNQPIIALAAILATACTCMPVVFVFSLVVCAGVNKPIMPSDNATNAPVFSKQAYMGNRWCEIAKLLPGRTENAVKNRFNSSARKKWLDQNPGGASLLTPDLLNKVRGGHCVAFSREFRICHEWRVSSLV